MKIFLNAPALFGRQTAHSISQDRGSIIGFEASDRETNKQTAST